MVLLISAVLMVSHLKTLSTKDSVWDGYLVKLARDLTRVFTPKGSVLEGKSPYFREI